MDLGKLNSQLDIKNLDMGQITRLLAENQNSIIKLVLIAGTLLTAGILFNDHRVKEAALRLQISQAQEKLEAIKSREAADKDLNAFNASLPKKLNESELITLISNYARSENVTIISLSPAESVDMGLYDVISVSFKAGADTFKNTMLFLRKIEKSTFPLRVNKWSGTEDSNGKITFDISISAVIIHS